MIPIALQAIGTGLSVMSSLQQGQAAKRQARYQEQQYRIQMEQEKLATLQRTNDRNEELLANEKINRAFLFSKLGRDPSDRSVKAFLEKQRTLASQDVDRLQSQHMQTMGNLQMSIGLARSTAKNAMTGALLGASGAVASGLFRYYEYKADEE
jgi:hypothetical protein